jgi:hypothetical protein
MLAVAPTDQRRGTTDDADGSTPEVPVGGEALGGEVGGNDEGCALGCALADRRAMEQPPLDAEEEQFLRDLAALASGRFEIDPAGYDLAQRSRCRYGGRSPRGGARSGGTSTNTNTCAVPLRT